MSILSSKNLIQWGKMFKAKLSFSAASSSPFSFILSQTLLFIEEKKQIWNKNFFLDLSPIVLIVTIFIILFYYMSFF